VNAILTPPVISKLPLGLLGFFGIKNGGQYPQTLGNSISPTMDLTEMLAANHYANYVYIAAPTAVGFTQATAAISGVPQSVPDNEVWFISSMSMHLTTGVGDAYNASPVVRTFQAGGASAWYRVLAAPFTIGASTNIMYPLPFMENGSRWLSPGDLFGFWANSFTLATNIAINIQVRVTRFPF
jgi:hypothetical protein